jgi:coenzyme F420 biosynthesis associated uncharacterized protein
VSDAPPPGDPRASGPLVDERVAIWAASLVAPARRNDPVAVARLRAEIADDLPRIDEAARRWTQLGADLPPVEARVIGRLSWVRTNLSACAAPSTRSATVCPVAAASRPGCSGCSSVRCSGLLSTKVLGQFVLPLGGPGGGELLVVGPNVLELGEQHGELATDIRRTVVLHEVTHRLQFDGAPWLGDHLRGLIDRYLADARVDREAVLELAPGCPGRRRRQAHRHDPAAVDAVLTPEQAEIVHEAQGLMSLLEGHGNAAMFDAAAEDLIADPDAVRAALNERRGDVTSKVLTAVAGMEMKRRQYREGEEFVRGVLEIGGMAALNRAFDRPEHLPRGDEVADPAGWVARVTAA